MPTLTITIDNEENKNAFKKVLKEFNYITDVEEDDEAVSQEIKDILDERWKKYKENPESTISLEQFKQNMKAKFGYDV